MSAPAAATASALARSGVIADRKLRLEALQEADDRELRHRADRGDVGDPVGANAPRAARLRRLRHGRHEDRPVQRIVRPRLARDDEGAGRNRERHFTAPCVMPATNWRDSTT